MEQIEEVVVPKNRMKKKIKELDDGAGVGNGNVEFTPIEGPVIDEISSVLETSPKVIIAPPIPPPLPKRPNKDKKMKKGDLIGEIITNGALVGKTYEYAELKKNTVDQLKDLKANLDDDVIKKSVQVKIDMEDKETLIGLILDKAEKKGVEAPPIEAMQEASIEELEQIEDTMDKHIIDNEVKKVASCDSITNFLYGINISLCAAAEGIASNSFKMSSIIGWTDNIVKQEETLKTVLYEIYEDNIDAIAPLMTPLNKWYILMGSTLATTIARNKAITHVKPDVTAVDPEH